MITPRVELISHETILSLNLPLNGIYRLVEEGFRLHGAGLFENPPKQGVHTRQKAFMHVMPAYLPSLDIAGMKLVSVYPDNPEIGLDTTTGMIAMLDPNNGLISAQLDARWITNVRTAMVSMVTIKYLHVSDGNPIIGIIGATGASGMAHIESISEVFPGSRILINSRSQERCDLLIERYKDLNCEIVAVMNPEEMARQCDVLIICASRNMNPLGSHKWLHQGQTICNVNNIGWENDILSHVDLVSCDDWNQLNDFTNGVGSHYKNLRCDFELGAVITQKSQGRTSQDQIVFALNYGLALFDILVANWVLKMIRN